MKYFLNFLILLSGVGAFAQKPLKNPIDSKLSLLLNRKMQYEKWREISQEASDISFAKKRDSIYNLYIILIKDIKKQPQVYLNHINKAIQAGKVEYEGTEKILYNYVDITASSIDVSLYSLTRLDAYKVIKHSLFEKNESQLPERTDLYIKKGGTGRVGFTIPPVNIKDTAKFRGDREIH